MNKLVVLSGVAGSGKSFITALIKEKKPEGHCYIVSSDGLRALVGGDQQNFTNEELIWKMYYEIAKIYALDKDGIVILDSTNTKRIFRIDKVEPLKPLFDKLFLVTFDIEKNTVLMQNEDRRYPIPKDALIKMIENFEYPNEIEEKFYNKLYFVKNIDDCGDIAEEIVK